MSVPPLVAFAKAHAEQRKRRTASFAQDMRAAEDLGELKSIWFRYTTTALTDGQTISPHNAVWVAYGERLDTLLRLGV